MSIEIMNDPQPDAREAALPKENGVEGASELPGFLVKAEKYTVRENAEKYIADELERSPTATWVASYRAVLNLIMSPLLLANLRQQIPSPGLGDTELDIKALSEKAVGFERAYGPDGIPQAEKDALLDALPRLLDKFRVDKAA